MVENQLPITDDDIKNIPDIVNSPNFLVYGTKSASNKDGIGYLKTMNDGTTYYVEEINDDDKQLVAKTMYKIAGSLLNPLFRNPIVLRPKRPPLRRK